MNPLPKLGPVPTAQTVYSAAVFAYRGPRSAAATSPPPPPPPSGQRYEEDGTTARTEEDTTPRVTE